MGKLFHWKFFRVAKLKFLVPPSLPVPQSELWTRFCLERPQMTPKHFTWVYYMIVSHVGPIWSLLGTHGGPKGPIWPKTDPNWEKSSWALQSGQIWSQLLPIGLTGFESCLPHTLAWYWASSGPPGPPKRTRFGPKRTQKGTKFKIVTNLSCDQ